MKVQSVSEALNTVSPLTKEKTQKSHVLHPNLHLGSWEAGSGSYG